jgi:hypothetical protein
MQNYVAQDNATHFDVNDLKIDKTSLSSTIRKKTSASDPRHSSMYIGCVGIVVSTMAKGKRTWQTIIFKTLHRKLISSNLTHLDM